VPTRLYIDQPLLAGSEFSLPSGPARHVRVLRLQPCASLTLFDGRGGEFAATVTHMGRSEVRVRVGVHDPVDRELARPVTLALGIPANERMDTLIEKATELGVAAIAPLTCERSVLRLLGERADRRLAHWRGVAVAACEQSGRTRVPTLACVAALPAWLMSLPPSGAGVRWLLSLGDAPTLEQSLTLQRGTNAPVLALSGPEGGLSKDEETLALGHGFTPVNLGPRVMRADTAPLAVLACLGLMGDPSMPR